MRFPSSINKNTYIAYKNNLKLESERVLKAENFEWDTKHPKSLVLICIESLSKNWNGEFQIILGNDVIYNTW